MNWSATRYVVFFCKIPYNNIHSRILHRHTPFYICIVCDQMSSRQPSAGAGVQGAEPPEACMIHRIVHYVGNFIPNGSIVVNLCSETQSGIKFPTGNFIPDWVGTIYEKFYYIEETNSHTSVYYTNYMGIVFPITT